MSKVKNCPACEKEVAKSAKVCPGCGKKLKKGVFFKIFVGLVVLVVLSVIFGPSKEDKARQLAAELEKIESAQPAKVSPTGELAELFSFGSENTDIQRDNMEKEIDGKIVQWSLPVFEVKKRDEKLYRVQTRSGSGNVGTFLTLQARSSDDVAYIENLKTGSIIRFKGRIDGVSIRNIDIDPAILISR